ncbi:MAG: methylated-DNA--[protein]-cysteine S-methyltransferase [Candidatus Latescibacterota bacterium]|nr:MAG: methylated-DNA--[protein]-cysteine S-methyltransferase [Candidatus Latescibacterota bacterium]
MQLIVSEVDSPVGRLRLVTCGRKLCALEFVEGARAVSSGHAARALAEKSTLPATAPKRATDPAARDVARRLGEYFAGDLRALDAIEVDPSGTAFQRKVWSALRIVRPGQTLSYADLARAIGAPKAVRAVGMANARNPIAIVVPCHRVIGADGSLTGYGGGLERKRWLLQHEGALALLDV